MRLMVAMSLLINYRYYVFISKSTFPKYFHSAVVGFGSLCFAAGADRGLTRWKMFNKETKAVVFGVLRGYMNDFRFSLIRL